MLPLCNNTKILDFAKKEKKKKKMACKHELFFSFLASNFFVFMICSLYAHMYANILHTILSLISLQIYSEHKNVFWLFLRL